MKRELLFKLFGASASLLAVLILMATAAASDTERILYNFAGGSSDGQLPVGGLVGDASGNLYGTTGAGGGYGNCSPFGQTCGVVFQLTPGSGGNWSEIVLYTFTGGADGGEPLAGLAIDAKGNLYGTTALGGASGLGTVFMLSPNSGNWTETVLYSFTGGSDGAYPQSPVTLRKGNLYGMTYAGGGNYCVGAPSGCGVIFELAPGKGSWAEKVLYQFANGTDGAFPYANLAFDKAGNLYGTTTQGGYLYGNCAPYGCGNVFELKHSSKRWSLLPLYAFTYDSDGSTPYGGVVFDPGGNMYGNTATGGASFYGTAFELKPAKGSWKFSVIHAFTGPPDAGIPESAFVLKAGRLYGTSYGGGTGSGCFFGSPCGTVYKLAPAKKGWKSTVLHSFTFNDTDGVYPEDGLISGKSGLLYGTTNAGGSADQGTVFSIKP